MVHELLGIKNNRIDMSSVPNISKELRVRYLDLLYRYCQTRLLGRHLVLEILDPQSAGSHIMRFNHVSVCPIHNSRTKISQFLHKGNRQYCKKNDDALFCSLF